MSSDWLQVEWNFVKAKFRGMFRKRKLNFMAIHYIYIGSWAIISSILLYPAGDMPYIDALFFGAGASTQSGLNTIDVNKLHTYQQVVLYFVPMFTNPIMIHGAVVFVRLYWFEKRFQSVVQEAMHWRRSRTRSPTRTMEKARTAPAHENGVRGKSIVVMKDGHPLGSPEARTFKNTEGPNGSAIDPSPSSTKSNKDDDSTKSERSQVPPLASDRFKREVLFADQVMDSPTMMSPTTRFPEPRSPDHHIAFLERQRNPEDKGALRIPGPRDFDRGKLPERISSDEERNDLSKVDTKPLSVDNEGERRHSDQLPRPAPDREARRNITIDDSARPTPIRPIRTNQSRVTFRRSETSNSNAIMETDEPLTPRPRPRARSNTLASFLRTTTTQRDPGPVPYLSWQPTVGRNSAFVDLTEEQREELGGIEYRSLKTLAVVIISYFFFWHLCGVIMFVPWIKFTEPWGGIVDSDGVNRSWWAIFSSATLFNDVGFTLTPDSFISFQLAALPLLLGALLIIVGNTGFPCMLRLWLWVLQKIVPQSTSLWEELQFLLDHPRRCFTLLFPSAATWVLFAILVLLNVIDLIFFIILDLNDPTVTVLPPGYRFLGGLFQAASTRTAGTAVVNLSELHPGIQVSYLIMMYISVFPIAISMRRTNVYEERSLGVYSNVDEEEEDPKEPSYIGAHLRKQLSFDLWFIFLGLFVVAIAEGGRISDTNEPNFDLFACLFEIVSAYGTVGLSLGYPTINASFSAEFTVVSKLVIIAMMIRGRHRGLPYQLDRAVLLPSENLHRKEDEDARRRRRFSVSSLTNVPTGTYSTAVNTHPNGILAPLVSRGSHRSFTARPRDTIAKAASGAEHAHETLKAEIHTHS